MMNLLTMSMAGGVMIAVIALLRALMLKRLPKWTFVMLWFAVLMRLLIPFSIPFRFSAYSAAERAGTALPQRAPLQVAMRALPGVQVAPLSEVMDAVAQAPAEETPAPTPPLSAPAPVSSGGSVEWLVIAYAAGAFAVTAFFLAAYVRGRRLFSDAAPVEGGYAAQWLSQNAIRRRVTIRASDRICSPVTYGFFRPVILLCPSVLTSSEQALDYVLVHEMTHVKRFDALWKLLFTAALCAHWFNPLVWLMYILYNRDVELSCDEAVIRKLGDKSKADYAMFLIGMQEGIYRFMPLCNSFSRHGIKERIVAVMKYKKVSAFTGTLALILVLCVMGGFATSAEQSATQGSEGSQMRRIDEISYDPPPPSETMDEYMELVRSLMTPGYRDMSVAEFRKRFAEVFPGDEGSGILDAVSSADSETLSLTQEEVDFLYGPFFYTVAETTVSPICAEYKNPWDPPGCEGSIWMSEYPNEEEPWQISVDYLLSYDTLDPEGISISERSALIREYEERFNAYIKSLPPEEFIKDNTLTTLRAERDRLSQEISTPALRVRALNMVCYVQKEWERYLGYSNFFDNTENPPEQAPLTLTTKDVEWFEQNTYVGMRYGVEGATKQGVVSPDGVAWYANGYRDPETGVSHRYNAQDRIYEISPDNGATWYAFWKEHEMIRSAVFVNRDTKTVLEYFEDYNHYVWDQYSNYAEETEQGPPYDGDLTLLRFPYPPGAHLSMQITPGGYGTYSEVWSMPDIRIVMNSFRNVLPDTGVEEFIRWFYPTQFNFTPTRQLKIGEYTAECGYSDFTFKDGVYHIYGVLMHTDAQYDYAILFDYPGDGESLRLIESWLDQLTLSGEIPRQTRIE